MSPQVTEIFQGASAVFAGPVGLAFSLTLLGAIALGSLRRIRAEQPGPEAVGPSIDRLPQEARYPIVQADPDQVERLDVVNRILHLMKEDDWDRIATEIAAWEGRLDATPGGARKHEIAVETCLAPLQAMLDDAPRRRLDDIAPAQEAVKAFVARHREAPLDPILAVLAARAHLAVAETCQADFWPDSERRAAWRQMAHHYVHAEEILAPFDPVAFMSPLLAGANYALSLGMPDGGARRQPAFEDWIDLDPSNPAIFAAHMPNLAGEDRAALDAILSEANRAEERTRETLGMGGYALALLPVLDDVADLREAVDTRRFAGGLMDLARLAGTQAEVNWAASVLDREARIGGEARRNVLLSAFDGLVRQHLTVIYPRLWGDSPETIRASLSQSFARSAAEESPPERSARASRLSPAAA